LSWIASAWDAGHRPAIPGQSQSFRDNWSSP